jgi:hypothetical protein
LHPCAGALEHRNSIDGESHFQRVAGWVYDAARGAVPPFAFLVADGTIQGVVRTGRPRRDISAAPGDVAREGGFIGFVQAQAPPDLTIYCGVGPS